MILPNKRIPFNFNLSIFPCLFVQVQGMRGRIKLHLIKTQVLKVRSSGIAGFVESFWMPQ